MAARWLSGRFDRWFGFAALVFACLFQLGTLRATEVSLTHGPMAVDINDTGLIVGAPLGEIETIDGAHFVFGDDIAEWFGVCFDLQGTRYYGCGEGALPDWDGLRLPVTVMAFEASADSVTAVSEIAGLELTSYFRFDENQLIVTVTLTNTTSDPIQNILYSREWLSTPEDPIYWTFPYDLPVPAASTGVARRLWMPDDLLPGSAKSLTFSYRRAGVGGPLGGGVDVPLTRWLGGSFPGGLNFGQTNGISFGDYDGDGWIDVFACMSGNLWRNLGGEDWQLAADLDSVLPSTVRRYGASFGDFNNDGLPDIGTEPRKGWGGDECFHLLRNEGDEVFTDIATQPALLDLQPCAADAETICWGDVNGDGNLDMVLPVYPPWAFGSPGNFFLFNLGATGPDDQYRFTEESAAAGLDNPPGTARSEGAMFVDVDADGDMDFYCNGTLYQNKSTVTTADFDAMDPSASGIGLSTQLDEGAALFDKDLDGDYDLAIVYTGPGVRIWENRGDGQFFQAPITDVASYTTGLDLGLSFEDWDNDGDIDFTTRQVFRRNQLIETGYPSFTVATHSITAGHLTSATPSWGDWDKDGDLDCALGNWLATGNFYENTLYDDATPMSERRYVRVRVLRDSVTVPAGLETEFGANVEIIVHGDPSPYRRRKATSSAGGYLNQNEYTLHFALPANIEDDVNDLIIDVVVDLPSLPSQGLRRIDKHVNPILGALSIGDLASREVVVFRSGLVVIDGVEYPAPGYEEPVLTTVAGGLALATSTTALPVPTTQGFARVGVAFNTNGASERVRIRELLIDGELAEPQACAGNSANVRIYDVTNPAAAFVVDGGAIAIPVRPHNRRTTIPADVLLDVDRSYRMIANVESWRATTIAAPIVYDDLTVEGGIKFLDLNPCSGDEEATAVIDPAAIYTSFRFAAVHVAVAPFVRGDCNGDDDLGVADAVFLLSRLFSGGATGTCDDACDANDDGGLDLADAITLLNALFGGGGPLPEPYPECGPDPVADSLECASYSGCP